MTNNRNEQKITIVFGDELLEAGYTSVPNLLLDRYAHVGMSSDELVFVLHLLQYKWTDKDPFPSLQTIAAKMGKSWRQVHRYAQSLKRKLLLTITSRVLAGRGRTTSEYDLSPLFAAVLPKHQVVSPQVTPSDLSKVSDGPSVKSVRGDLSPVTGVEANEEEAYKELKLSKREKRGGDVGLRAVAVRAWNGNGTAPVPTIKPDKIRRLVATQQPVPARDIVFRRLPAPSMTPQGEGRQAIEAYISGFAREFGDRAVLKASVSRAYNLFRRSGVELGTFLAVLYEASRRCKDYSAATSVIPRVNGRSFAPRNQMAYFFAIVERILSPSEPTRCATDGGVVPN